MSSTPSESYQDEFQTELIQMVRDQIGAVASLKEVAVVPGLPTTRSGKILRKTMRGIADGLHEPAPSTIDDIRSLLDGRDETYAMSTRRTPPAALRHS